MDLKGIADHKGFEVELLVDALYFHAARQALERALGSNKKIVQANQRWKKLEKREQIILDRYGGDARAAYDDLESIYIQMEGADYQIGQAHAPLFKEVTLVHILCSASLEAHINVVAASALGGKEHDYFERLSLEAKWLYLPKLCGWESFDPGQEPFQGFSRLVRTRNQLVHYKSHNEMWVQGTIPDFVDKLGLSESRGKESIDLVAQMIRALAERRRVSEPYWLRDDIDEMDYLAIIRDRK